MNLHPPPFQITFCMEPLESILVAQSPFDPNVQPLEAYLELRKKVNILPKWQRRIQSHYYSVCDEYTQLGRQLKQRYGYDFTFWRKTRQRYLKFEPDKTHIFDRPETTRHLQYVTFTTSKTGYKFSYKRNEFRNTSGRSVLCYEDAPYRNGDFVLRKSKYLYLRSHPANDYVQTTFTKCLRYLQVDIERFRRHIAARRIQRSLRQFFERPFYPNGRQGFYSRATWKQVEMEMKELFC